MSCSPARMIVNRANAQKSTGPRTPEGKEASRRNSLKHGLTGQGIVISGEDVDAIDERAETLQSELAPEGNLMSRILVRRVAAMSVRVERCARQETAQIADRVRTAPDDFDEERRAKADHLLSRIDQAPTANHRQLLAMPEGVDLLLSRLVDLRADLDHPSGRRWTERHGRMFDEAAGRDWGAVFASRCRVLTETILGVRPDRPDRDEPVGTDAEGRVDWAAALLLELIDSEIARLQAHQAALDLDTIALSREESAERALFDPGPAATLARKYEANAERAMYKALKELREARPQAESPRSSTGQRLGTTLSRDEFGPERFGLGQSLGSFFPVGGGGTHPSDFTVGLTNSPSKPRQDPEANGSDPAQNRKSRPRIG